MFRGVSSFPSSVKVTMPTYDSDNLLKGQARNTSKTDMAPPALQNPSACCLRKRKRKECENISPTKNVKSAIDSAESQKL